jgi:hypothetical protein
MAVCINPLTCVDKLKFIGIGHLQPSCDSTALGLVEVVVLHHDVALLWFEFANDFANSFVNIEID